MSPLYISIVTTVHCMQHIEDITFPFSLFFLCPMLAYKIGFYRAEQFIIYISFFLDLVQCVGRKGHMIEFRPLIIIDIKAKLLTFRVNLWQLLTFCDNGWLIVTIIDTLWQWLTLSDNYWHFVTTIDTFWQLLTLCVNYWHFVTIIDTLW